MQETGDAGSIPELGRYPGIGNGNPLQYFLPAKFHGQKSLVGYNPRGHKELAITERLPIIVAPAVVQINSVGN